MHAFDLEAEIRVWRNVLAARANISSRTLDELESHLREEIRRQEDFGHPPEEAFQIARRRLGSPAELEQEFGKVQPVHFWARAPFCLAVVVQGLFLVLLPALLLINYEGPSAVRWVLIVHVAAITLGYIVTFLAGASGLVYFLGRCFRDWSPGEVRYLGKTAHWLACEAVFLCALGLGFGGWWAQVSWGRFWGWDPKEIGALAVLLWNSFILLAAARRWLSDTAILRSMILGNALTACAWFGVNLLGAGLHQYGFTGRASLWLQAFVASQILLFALSGRRLRWQSRLGSAPFG